MKTLYEKRPEIWEKIEKAGYKNVAALAKRFHSNVMMDRSLGYVNATTGWNTGTALPSVEAEHRAAYFLEHGTPPIISKAHTPLPAKSKSDDAGDMLLVACPSGSVAKVRMVLAMLNCEVVDF